MIGISFVHPDIADQFRRPPWTELRCARVEPGQDSILGNEVYYWRSWELPLEERTRLMSEVVKDLEIDGFTLWWHWSKNLWQMNIRRKNEGWVISHISQAEAEAVFRTLEQSHPDGPWKVRPDYVQDDAAAQADVLLQKGGTAAVRYEKSIEDVFDSTIEGEEPPSLDLALKRAAEAVERGVAVLARVAP